MLGEHHAFGLRGTVRTPRHAARRARAFGSDALRESALAPRGRASAAGTRPPSADMVGLLSDAPAPPGPAQGTHRGVRNDRSTPTGLPSTPPQLPLEPTLGQPRRSARSDRHGGSAARLQHDPALCRCPRPAALLGTRDGLHSCGKGALMLPLGRGNAGDSVVPAGLSQRLKIGSTSSRRRADAALPQGRPHGLA